MAMLLKNGAKGEHVKRLQRMLNAVASLQEGRLVVDGDFGPATLVAVKHFQQENGLVADGIVGAKTWNYLLALAKNPQAPVLPRSLTPRHPWPALLQNI
ncbi:peptidoglycan-binding protein [Teredinibacter turnerae]|uniref:peptidoglycan-binding domain-containing protein n=1 Tax=Teredinibacter turnerae TaxID=2426 RepID=UPI00036BA922|nr:peptidoglycan-binding protein [Teredinibacter turnerae]